MMLKILEEVAKRRLKIGGEINFQIQLSSLLMSKAVDAVNKRISKSIQKNETHIKQDLTMNEFQFSSYDSTWTIINRAYRDDTNDSDVEEVLYDFVINNTKQ